MGMISARIVRHPYDKSAAKIVQMAHKSKFTWVLSGYGLPSLPSGRKSLNSFAGGEGWNRIVFLEAGLPEMRRAQILAAIDETFHKSDRLLYP